MEPQDRLKAIPSVDAALMYLESGGHTTGHPRAIVVRTVRTTLERARRLILEGSDRYSGSIDSVRETILGELVVDLGRAALRTLLPVVNGTGIIIHTNLGRAPLAGDAVSNIAAVASGYSNLEYELTAGKRGKRDFVVRDALCEVTGAEDALVVNNNAAALMLALNSLAFGRDVLVSRGELIEIGGSFRLPEVLEKSGAMMVEVGTTNRTRLSDFEGRITNRTGCLLSAHWSNYEIIGFVERVGLKDLVGLGRRHGIPVIHDLGSGALLDTSDLGLPGEMTVRQSIEAGVSVATFSGDKLLGGPQAGIAAGDGEVIRRMRANPLARALRPGKLTLAALATTVSHYLSGDAQDQIPVLKMITTPLDELNRRATAVAERLRAEIGGGTVVSIESVRSRIGGGAMPERDLESVGISIRSEGISDSAISSSLLLANPPVVVRARDGKAIIDLRTVLPEQDDSLLRVLAEVLKARDGA
jgi:L-seryl-tRNA(Ser) seleniumtransferase